ncbi:MAG: RNA polymerase factor sigma-32, partial [Alphaproteobacteria bacterium]
MVSATDLVVYENKSNLPVIIEDDGLQKYLEQIKQFPVLSEEEENKLIRDFKEQGDLQAAQKLITSHLRLAVKIALTYRRYGLPTADLISEANIGLMQAVKKFDMNKKVRLSTYAMLWIKAALNDFVLRSWSLVKIGTVAAQKKLFYNLGRIKARLGLYDNKELEPTVVKKIANELVVSEKDVVEMNRRMGGDSSLNKTVGNDEDAVEAIDLLADKSQNVEGHLANKQEADLRRQILLKALAKLNDREQYIVKNRMLTDTPQTLDEIGDKF